MATEEEMDAVAVKFGIESARGWPEEEMAMGVEQQLTDDEVAALMESFVKYGAPKLRYVFLSGNPELSDAAARALAGAMRAKALPTLEVIHFRQNAITDAGAAEVVSAISEALHVNIREIEFEECEGVGDETLRALTESLRRMWENPDVGDIYLEKLDFAGSQFIRHHIGDSALSQFATALLERDFYLNHLEEINLSDNDITDEGFIKLCEAIADGRLPKLEHLYLSCNKISNVGAQKLADAFTAAREPLELYDMRLDYQLVGWDGRRAIVEAAKARNDRKVSVILKHLEFNELKKKNKYGVRM